MLFSSISFLYYFLPATLLLYFLAPKKLKNTVLLLASLFFYAWGEQKLVVLFAGTILVGWVFGRLIEKFHKKRAVSAAFLWLSIILNIAVLGYFKYADFFITGINSLFGISLPLLRITLPIGISFYMFQIISYTIDVYRRTVPARKNLIDFGAYVACFPQLIAGPIVRYSDIAVQLKNRIHTAEKIASGIRRFLIGLGKKVLIANAFGELIVLFRSTQDSSVLYYWLYAVSFTLQIYYDFSGYSDMAIGLGKILGFEFMENFNYPYISKSITEFWRRWHISLGSWFRDYVYIPLGGNKKGISRQLFNILVVWALTGLWHGAAMNFVLWGLFFAILLIFEKLGLKKIVEHHPVMGHAYTLFTVVLGFVLFNASSLTQALNDLLSLFGGRNLPLVSSEAIYYLRSYAVLFIIAIIGSTPVPKNLMTRMKKKKESSTILFLLETIFLLNLLLICTAYLVDGSFNPFLYFRF